MLKVAICTLLFVAYVAGDCYMHNPRGSNNRCSEANTNRNNANRLFDSQNNGKGGYCKGAPMTYYEGSLLSIEWTNQHGCGENPRMYCNVVLQYMCGSNKAGAMTLIRDGTTTDTIPDDPSGPAQKDANGEYEFGMQEPYQYYQDCKTRQRNMGLWISDREAEGNLNPGRAAAIFTRQNNDGNRHGYECAEERDYYPYWHPSPWRDVAILTHNTDWCGFYKSESQNVKKKGYCVTPDGDTAPENNPTACKAAANKWKEQKAWGIPKPECVRAPWSRENQLGNGHDGQPNTYNWTLPSTGEEECIGKDECNCVLRIRYNISTAEVGDNQPDKGFLDWKDNAGASPIHEDEIVNQDGLPHQLALDTSQYGRTFEDRSFVFHIKKRPSGVPASARIFNLNVRGKRGNIVQTYPSVEYDFMPNKLAIRVNDYIHFQWTGCDENPAGNAGEGTDGTDRSNMVQIKNLAEGKPADDKWISGHNALFRDKKYRMRMSMLDQKDCLSYEELLKKNNDDENAAEQDVQNCMKLNAASPYFDGGVYKMTTPGTYYYMSTRNHNFSNRDQKGVIDVQNLLPNWAIGVVVTGAVLFVGAAGVAGAMFYAKSHPHSGIANIFSKM